MGYADIHIRIDAAGAQNVVAQSFAANGFRVSWENALKGKAEKGSKGANIAFGALAQYYGIDFEIYPGPQGTVLRLVQTNSGMAGGLIGMSAVKKKFKGVSDSIAGWMQANGMLLAYNQQK